MIRISHLRKEYPNVTPLKDVNVTINKGDVIYHRSLRYGKIHSYPLYQYAGNTYIGRDLGG